MRTVIGMISLMPSPCHPAKQEGSNWRDDMGTRSLTRVFDGDKELACIYRQFDGYPEGHGKDLAAILVSGRFVNGIRFGESGRFFNGMGCFAAQLVCELKTGTNGEINAGGVYLYPAGSEDVGEEFVYEVHGGLVGEGWDRTLGPVTVKCIGYGKEMFDGSPADFLKFCEEPEVASS